MTREEIDRLWQRALMASVRDGEQFTRYHFAALVLEEAAKVCDERAMKNERACDGLDDEDATSLRSAAWQMSVCAADIRALKGAKE